VVIYDRRVKQARDILVDDVCGLLGVPIIGAPAHPEIVTAADIAAARLKLREAIRHLTDYVFDPAFDED
jgi:hypothetical protein